MGADTERSIAAQDNQTVVSVLGAPALTLGLPPQAQDAPGPLTTAWAIIASLDDLPEPAPMQPAIPALPIRGLVDPIVWAWRVVNPGAPFPTQLAPRGNASATQTIGYA